MKVRSFYKKTMTLLIISILTVVLSACMSSSSDNEKTEDGKPIIKMGRVTLQNPKLPDGDTYENNAYTRLVEEEIGAKIVNEFEAEGEDYDRQVALAISSGDMPDMMRVSTRDELIELAENDLIADLTDVFDEHASDYIKEVYDSYDGRVLADATFDGRLMAIPATVADNAPNIVWIRKDWLDDLGIELDSDENGMITIEELEKTAKAFIENDPGNSGNPVGLSFVYWLNAGDYGGSGLAMTSVASAFNAHPRQYIEDENGNLIYGSTSEEVKQSLGVLRDWFEQGILDPQFGTRTWDDIMALLTNGQTGITTGPWHFPDWALPSVKEMDENAMFMAYTLEGENGKANVFHENPTGQFMVVRKDYQHPELAVQILNLMYDDLVNEKDLETKYPEIAEYNKLGVDGSTRPFNIEVQKSTSGMEDYLETMSAVNGEISIDELSNAGLKADAESIIDYMENPDQAETSSWSKYQSRTFGRGLYADLVENDLFNWTTPVYFGTTKTMERKGANLLKLEEEAFIKIVTGSEPLDYFDTFVSKWKSQGGDEIIEEIKAELVEKE